MFDLFSPQHLIILLIVLLVVVGPKDLPRMMHTAGRWIGKARGMANEFKKSFDDMARQEELDKLREELDVLRKNHLDNIANIPNPVADLTFPDSVTAEPVPEPRSGEFQVNEAIASASPAEAPVPPGEPALAAGHEPPKP